MLSTVKLIAEPWDIGGAALSGRNFPPPFAEWNDHFRDAARRFWLLRNLTTGEFACRFAASSDVFYRNGRAPGASVRLTRRMTVFAAPGLRLFQSGNTMRANGEGKSRRLSNSNYSDNRW